MQLCLEFHPTALKLDVTGGRLEFKRLGLAAISPCTPGMQKPLQDIAMPTSTTRHEKTLRPSACNAKGL